MSQLSTTTCTTPNQSKTPTIHRHPRRQLVRRSARHVNHLGREPPLAQRQKTCQLLSALHRAPGLSHHDRIGVVDQHTGPKLVARAELPAELVEVDAIDGILGRGGLAREHLGELLVKVDEVLRDHLPLGRVRIEQARVRQLGQNVAGLPCPVERVLQGEDVARLGVVCFGSRARGHSMCDCPAKHLAGAR